MAIADLFIFKSKKQREKERRAYIKKMYPLGEESQHTWEVETVHALFPDNKRQWTEYHYILLILRQELLRADAPLNDDDDDDDEKTLSEEMIIKTWRGNHTTRAFSEDVQKKVVAMAFLENAAGSIEELPTLQKILANAESIELPAPVKPQQGLFG